MSYIMCCLVRFNRLTVLHFLVIDCGFARITFTLRYPQQSALPPLATTPSPPPHTKLLCFRTVPGNSRPRCSLLRSSIPPHNGCHRCQRRRRCGVCQRLRLEGGEASSWTAFTLPPEKWWKYEGLGLHCRWWQQSQRHVTLVSDKVIKNFNGKVNRRWW